MVDERNLNPSGDLAVELGNEGGAVRSAIKLLHPLGDLLRGARIAELSGELGHSGGIVQPDRADVDCVIHQLTPFEVRITTALVLLRCSSRRTLRMAENRRIVSV